MKTTIKKELENGRDIINRLYSELSQESFSTFLERLDDYLLIEEIPGRLRDCLIETLCSRFDVFDEDVSIAEKESLIKLSLEFLRRF